jgi:hypothetical protein
MNCRVVWAENMKKFGGVPVFDKYEQLSKARQGGLECF